MNIRRVCALSIVLCLIAAGVAGPLRATEGPATPAQVQMDANTNLSVQQAIQSRLAEDRHFAESELRVTVDDEFVLVEGKVRDLTAQDRAAQIAQSLAGGRRVLDHTKVERTYPAVR